MIFPKLSKYLGKIGLSGMPNDVLQFFEEFITQTFDNRRSAASEVHIEVSFLSAGFPLSFSLFGSVLTWSIICTVVMKETNPLINFSN